MRTFLRALMRRSSALTTHGRPGRLTRSLFGGAPAGLPLFMRTPAAGPGEPRIHDDADAHAAALGAGAHAFTRGEDIFVGPTVGTVNGPTRDEVLRHERVHVAQVEYGALTGRRASEEAVEAEAREQSHAGARSVQRGADPGALHGLFFDEEEESSASDSSSESGSSTLGMERSVWDHLLEAVSGAWEVGPIDAYAAGFGEDSEAAGRFGSQFADRWTRNAARHGVWQARLAFKYGEASAEAIGNAHEEGSPDALDSWIDQHNNRVAREIGAGAASLDEIPDLIQAAMDDGRLITSPADQRIPEALREPEPAL
jgi:hypothetical protein